MSEHRSIRLHADATVADILDFLTEARADGYGLPTLQTFQHSTQIGVMVTRAPEAVIE